MNRLFHSDSNSIEFRLLSSKTKYYLDDQSSISMTLVMMTRLIRFYLFSILELFVSFL
jgi:hypothetical protein